MRILYVTTIGTTMGFFPEHIRALVAAGHTVEIASNDTESAVPAIYGEMGIKTHTVHFSRSPLARENFKAIGELKRVIKEGGFDLIHTHTPNASAIVRLVCRRLRKEGLRVFYTAHGFHFYTGAPLKNWLIYYTIEKLCSRWTDVLITINDEDFTRATKKFKAENTVLVPGVGVDLQRFYDCQIDRSAERAALGLSPQDKVLIYIGELNYNKNQTSLIDMLAEISKTRDDVKLVLVGDGSRREALLQKAAELGVSQSLILTGYRRDIPKLIKLSDITVPSSIREGLAVNLVESMASGVPIVAYDNRGHRPIVKDGVTGYIVPNGDYKAMAQKVNFLLDNPAVAEDMAKQGYIEVEKYAALSVAQRMMEIYCKYGIPD